MKLNEAGGAPTHNQVVPGSSPGGPTTFSSKIHINTRYQCITGVFCF